MISAAFTLIILLASLFVHICPVYAQNLSPILFWGAGCPHCAELKEQIKQKELDKKITIDYREIYYNKDNADLFDQKIKECGISPYSAGVPLIYLDGRCWIGTDEIINILEKEIEGNGTNTTVDNSNNQQLDLNNQVEVESNNEIISPGLILVSIVVLVTGISIYFIWMQKKR